MAALLFPDMDVDADAVMDHVDVHDLHPQVFILFNQAEFKRDLLKLGHRKRPGVIEFRADFGEISAVEVVDAVYGKTVAVEYAVNDIRILCAFHGALIQYNAVAKGNQPVKIEFDSFPGKGLKSLSEESLFNLNGAQEEI